MERFMSKGSGVMSKDYFRQRGATVGPAPTKSEEPMTAPTVSASASASSLSVPDSGVGKSLLMFNGAGSRKASLGVGSQIMSKNHFRTLRPPKSKGIDGEGNGEPPAPTRMPSPPTLRRADTWAGSTDELPARGDPVTPVLPDPATESAGDPGIWSSCPALTLIEKRRKEEELLDKKHQEAISLWREIEGEALDSLVLEVPSEEEDDDDDYEEEKADAGAAAAAAAKAAEHRDHDEQQHSAPRPQNSDAAARPSPAEPSQPGGEKIGRMPSTMGDEEQDISDMTESNGVSEREDNGAGERVSKRGNTKTNNNHHINPDTDSPSNSSSVSLSFVPPKPSKVSEASKSVGALPVRRGTSALPPARSRKEQKKLKRASVLGVAKESARAGIDDDDDDDDVSDDDAKQSQATPRPLKKPGLYVGRFYSSLRRRAPLVHQGRTTAATAAESESESDDDKSSSSSSAKAEKKREKAEKKREKKAEKKREKKGAHEKGGDNGNEQGDEDEDDAHLDRRGTMPKNFKMHFMEKLKGGGETTGDEKDDHHQSSNEKRNKDKKKGKNKHNNKQRTSDHSKEAVRRQSSATDARRGSGASVLSYSEPEPDTSGKDRINGGAFNGGAESSDGSSSSGGELKKKLKKAQRKNKAQEEKIRKQQNELERMRKELERVRRQRKERRRKETEGEKEKEKEKEKKGKKGMANEAEGSSAGREEKRKAAAKKESEDEESGSKGNNKNPNKKKT